MTDRFWVGVRSFDAVAWIYEHDAAAVDGDQRVGDSAK
jgi:hypothetical protein